MIGLFDFLALYPKESTRKAYNRGLRRFLEYIHSVPVEKRGKRGAVDYDSLSLQYLQEEDRDLVADLRGFVTALADYAPKTAQLYWAATLMWLAENGRELSAREQRRLASRLPKGGAQTLDAPIDHQFLRQILPHMNILGRGLVLVMASSGVRLGGALSITLDDIDLDASPARLYIRGSGAKGGAPRMTFITGEAAETVREWLKVRDQYLQSSQRRNAGLIRAGMSRAKAAEDNRLFPVSQNTCWDLWTRALSAAGLDERDPVTGRLTRTYHGLRKFYLSQSKLVIPTEIPEALAGHRGYLSGAYRRYTEEQLADYYRQAEPQLSVMAPAEVREIQSEFRSRMQAHSEILENLVSENIALKKRLEVIEELQARMDEISLIVARHDDSAEGDDGLLS